MALIRRRALLSSVALVGASVLARGASQRGLWAQGTAPALMTSDSTRPSIPYGVASGDVTSDFVVGPLHAGTFGPNKLDNTFGPQVKFLSIPNDLKPNRPPGDGLQFFGMVKVSGQDEVMTVSLHNLRGEKIYSVDLSPEA